MDMGESEWNFLLLAILAVVNAPAYWMLYKLLFTNVDELVEAIRFYFTPDVISWVRGEYHEDLWAELKLAVLVFVSGACVFGEYVALSSLVA